MIKPIPTKYNKMRDLVAEMRQKLEDVRADNRELRKTIKELEERLALMVGDK